MTDRDQSSNAPPRNLPRSVGAFFAGFVAVVVLSLATDEVLHLLGVYPPWGEPMNDVGDNLLALAYRCAYGVMGSYIAARLAPRSPMLHAMILGIVGFVVSLGGVVISLTHPGLGPLWYPIAIVLTAIPNAWLGGVLHRAWHRSS